jgi:hypothetical protein
MGPGVGPPGIVVLKRKQQIGCSAASFADAGCRRVGGRTGGLELLGSLADASNEPRAPTFRQPGVRRECDRPWGAASYQRMLSESVWLATPLRSNEWDIQPRLIATRRYD